MRQSIVALTGLLATTLPASAAGLTIPVGREFQVNTYTFGLQVFPSITSDASGNFVVVWVSHGQDGDSAGVFGQRFSAAGSALGTEFQVNTYTVDSQGEGLIYGYGSVDVSSAADGKFVIVWPSADGSEYGIFARLYDKEGAPIGLEFQASSYTLGNQRFPSLATALNGDFVVAWTDYLRDGSSSGVFGRRFDSSGTAQGSEFQLSTYTLSYQGIWAGPRVAVHGDGAFVAAWDSYRDGHFAGVFGRRFDSTGAGLGTEFQINTYTVSIQRFPNVAAAPDGNFIVAWSSVEDGSSSSTHARRFNSNGAPIGGVFQVNSYTSGFQCPFEKAVSVDADGRFVIVWTSELQDGWVSQAGLAGLGVFGRRYDSDGFPLGGEFQINTVTVGYQSTPVIAGGSGGDFVVAWQSLSQDGSLHGVFAQRFSNCGNAVIDADEQCDDGTMNSTPSSCCDANCEFKPNGDASCDGNPCTRPDSCTDGVCTPGACVDGGVCTICGGTCDDSGRPCMCLP